MKTFTSLRQFGIHLDKLILTQASALSAGLEVIAKKIEKDAKDEIGHLQPAVGNFNAWAELAPRTKSEKELLGYKFNDEYNPLLRTGEMRDSISHRVSGISATIGSTSDIMVYQELGTWVIPPRPVLGPAAYKNTEFINKVIGKVTVMGLLGYELIPSELQYNWET